MGSKERRHRRQLETRARILEAARHLLATQGYAGLSMRKLAQMVEYSPTAIYLHFEDKECLIRELHGADLAAALDRFLGTPLSADPIQRLKGIAHAYVDFYERYPTPRYAPSTIPESPPAIEGCPSSQVPKDPVQHGYVLLKCAVQQGINAGLFRSEIKNAESVAQSILAVVQGSVSLFNMHPGQARNPQILESRVDFILDALLAGLKPRPQH